MTVPYVKATTLVSQQPVLVCISGESEVEFPATAYQTAQLILNRIPKLVARIADARMTFIILDARTPHFRYRVAGESHERILPYVPDDEVHLSLVSYYRQIVRQIGSSGYAVARIHYSDQAPNSLRVILQLHERSQ